MKRKILLVSLALCDTLIEGCCRMIRFSNFNWGPGHFLITYHILLFATLPWYLSHYIPSLGILLSAFFMYAAGGLIITGGYHRLYSHRCYTVISSICFAYGLASSSYAAEQSQETFFKTVVLGCSGGPVDANLSSYLVAPKESDNYIAFDAGSLLSGIEIAVKKSSFEGIKVDPASSSRLELAILRDHIKCYLISHAHLDHLAGLVINSVVDTKKNIFGLDTTIDFIRDNLFNGKIWVNFGSEGAQPVLGLYTYHRVKPFEKYQIAETNFSVVPFILNHPTEFHSTAFLLEADGRYLLYCGDTSTDTLEKRKSLTVVWEKIAPLIKEDKLKAIFLECSFPADVSDNQLFGHIRTKYFIQEMKHLANLVNPAEPKSALRNMKVIVTHIKEDLSKTLPAREVIQRQLTELAQQNDLDLQLIFPLQGEKIDF